MDKERQVRSLATKFETREENDELHITGYFAVFGSNYDLWPGASESVDPHAFDNALNDDIRALIDHETRLVLGRTSAGTLTLKTDNHGLYGDVTINPADSDAMNCYARVKRGDVNQCSFGFDILDQEEEFNERTGDIHWTIKAVKLYEVSVCTFPAYTETSVSARAARLEELKKRSLDAWKARTMAKLKGES